MLGLYKTLWNFLEGRYTASMKYMGIDYGSKRIGIALSDEGGMMAFPRGIIDQTTQTLVQIIELIEREGVQAIVMSDSVDGQGNQNQIMAEAQKFSERLVEETSLPLYFQKEQFSSHEAAQLGGFGGYEKRNQANQQGRQKSREHIDDSAAAIILQRYLDKMSG